MDGVSQAVPDYGSSCRRRRQPLHHILEQDLPDGKEVLSTHLVVPAHEGENRLRKLLQTPHPREDLMFQDLDHGRKVSQVVAEFRFQPQRDSALRVVIRMVLGRQSTLRDFPAPKAVKVCETWMLPMASVQANWVCTHTQPCEDFGGLVVNRLHSLNLKALSPQHLPD